MWITTNWIILKEMGMPDHHNCPLRNLYAWQEATVRIEQGTMDWGHNWERGLQKMSWLFSITDSIDMSLSKLWEIVKDRDACVL